MADRCGSIRKVPAIIHAKVLLPLRCFDSHPRSSVLIYRRRLSKRMQVRILERSVALKIIRWIRVTITRRFWRGVKTMGVWRQRWELISWIASYGAHWDWGQRRLKIIRRSRAINDGVVLVGFEHSPMGRFHLEHLLLVRVRISQLQNREIGPVADLLSMKAFDNLLAHLRCFEPMIRSERMDLFKHWSKRPTLQTQPPDLFLESRVKSSVRGLRNQGWHIERVQPIPKGWVSQLGIRHQLKMDSPRHSFSGADLIHKGWCCQGYPRSLAEHYARAACSSAMIRIRCRRAREPTLANFAS